VRVTAVRWTPFSLPFRRPFATAAAATDHREGLLVELETDAGARGLGEAAPLPERGGSLAASLAALETTAPRLIGLDLADVPTLLEAPSLDAAARCALNTAALDAEARARGLPLAALLAPAPRPSVPVNAVIGEEGVDGAVAAARAAGAAGYGTLKLKVGLAVDREAELRRMAAVREAVGPGVRLRLDANGAWDAETAIDLLLACEGLGVELVEQPVAAADLEGLRRVQAAVAIPIAADESLADAGSARWLIEARAVRALVLKPALLGGPRKALALAAAAGAGDIACVVTTALEGGIGVAMALQVAAALGATPYAHGLATLDLLEDDLILAAPPVLCGEMRLPAAPGLGVELDEAALGRYASGARGGLP
jgi:o-succinylbenzoate synthase